MTAKHWSVNNVFWRVVAGRIGRVRGPDAARGPPVGQHWLTLSVVVDGCVVVRSTCWTPSAA